MMVETSRFGSLSVEENDIITFPEGMLGFSKVNQYVLVERSDDSLFLWLQAIKKPSVAFPLLEPLILDKSYRVEMTDEDRKLLELSSTQHAKVFSIVTIPTDPTKMTANMKAPIVINLKTRTAKQIILHNQDYAIRKPIFAELQHHCTASERKMFPESEAPSYHAIPISEDLGGSSDVLMKTT